MYFFKAVFFDFDGVLIDSLPAMKVAWSSVQKEFNIDINFDEFKKFIGLPFNNILYKLRLKNEMIPEITSYYFYKTSQNKNLIKLNPYTHNIISWLNKNNILTGIVTSKDKVRTLQLVNLFNINVDIIVTPELTPRGKPFSDPILYAADVLKTNLRNALFIGDMRSDMVCAKNSKCKYLHYMNGYGLKEYDFYGGHIYSIYEIKEYIKFFSEKTY